MTIPIQFLVLLLPLVALWSWLPLTPTSKMVAVSLSMYGLIKLHTLIMYRDRGGHSPNWSELLFWFLGWAGLDAPAFFDRPAGQGGRQSDSQNGLRLRSLGEALLKIAIGAALLLLIAPKLIPVSQLLAGWVGMAGIVILLHCGIIHLSAVWWNWNGRNVKPIMNSPLLATTVSEFWGKRWNLAFRDYAHVCLFSPLARKLNGLTATIAGFLFSGIVHDLAISVPAGGGYGWPTLYFILQGVALLSERYLKKSGFDLNKHWAGRIWTAAWVVGPAFILFHRPFVLKVIVPLIDWFAWGTDPSSSTL